MRVAELKAISRERALSGYSRLRKAELIALLGNNPPPPPPRARPPRLLRPSRDLPPPLQVQTQSIRFRPDRPRQPELMRRLEGIPAPSRPAPEFKPYQLSPREMMIDLS